MKHGKKKTREYRTWCNIVQRCTNPKNPAWDRYGGRGVRMCAGWRLSFAAFFAATGVRPSPKSELDRVDNDGHYSCGRCEECIRGGWPMNLRWATRRENVLNRAVTLRVERNGETRSLEEWCELVGLSPKVARRRLARGWAAERALTTPHQKSAGKTPEKYLYRQVWRGIISRCHNPANGSYPGYGGRGIVVCDRWRESYEAFAADMGPRPTPRHSLHRKDNDGPYSPENCVWESAKVQANARRVAQPADLTGPRAFHADPSDKYEPSVLGGLTHDGLVSLFREHGRWRAVADILGVSLGGLRRRRIELGVSDEDTSRHARPLPCGPKSGGLTFTQVEAAYRELGDWLQVAARFGVSYGTVYAIRRKGEGRPIVRKKKGGRG